MEAFRNGKVASLVIFDVDGVIVGIADIVVDIVGVADNNADGRSFQKFNV